MALLDFEDVSFSYLDQTVLARVSFELSGGKVFVILGPSGAGKSTVLRLAAGLDAPSSGSVRLNGRLASSSGRVVIEPARRETAMVFQDLALWPHLTSDREVAFAGPTLGSLEREKLLENVGLRGLANRLPAHMSGGERQRLALARALASKPRLLLLDEPFSSLDPPRRLELRELLLDLHRQAGIGILYVTHDLDDAFFLGDHIIFLSSGTIEQAGSPEELYRRPATLSVANFVGRAAIVDGRVRGEVLDTTLGQIPNPRPELREGQTVRVIVRPEDVSPGAGGLEALVEIVVYEKGRYLARASAGASPVWFHSASRLTPGGIVPLRVNRGWPMTTLR